MNINLITKQAIIETEEVINTLEQALKV